MKSFKIDANINNISKVREYLSAECKRLRINSKSAFRLVYQTEEILATLIEHAPEGAMMEIRLKRHFLIRSKIVIKIDGDNFNLTESIINTYKQIDFVVSEIDDDAMKRIRSFLQVKYRDDIKYKNVGNINIVNMYVGVSESLQLYQTVFALILGIIVGVLCSLFFSEDIQNDLLNYVFNPISSLFMNAMKFVVAPVVFFSVISCITSLQSLSELGKIGKRIMEFFAITTLCTMFITYILGVSFLSADTSIQGLVSETQNTAFVSDSSNTDVSLLSTILSVVPSNIISPFLDVNMLSVIFTAILVGVALLYIRDNVKILPHFFNEANDLFSRITDIIIKFVPIAIFATMATTAIMFTLEQAMSFVNLFLVSVGACIVMIIVYLILVLVISRVNPFIVLKEMLKPLLTGLSIGSSVACMPLTMQSCSKLGVSKQVYSCSIPLAITFNKNGTSILILLATMFMAKVYNIDLDLNTTVNLLVLTLVMSVAVPGISSGCLIVLATMFNSLAIPVESISLIIGIVMIFEMFSTATNIGASIVSSVLAASKIDFLDRSVYKKSKTE